jgi:hypothetical protein
VFADFPYQIHHITPRQNNALGFATVLQNAAACAGLAFEVPAVLLPDHLVGD